MTAMAITAMMSAYSTSPWPSSSRKNASILCLLPSCDRQAGPCHQGEFRKSELGDKPPARPRTRRETVRIPGTLRLAEIRVPARGDLGPELLQRAPRPRGLRPVTVAERLADRVAELGDRAAEELAGRLELRPEPEEAELVVAGQV